MSCFRPLTAWRGPVQASGKRSVVFKPGDAPPRALLLELKLPCGQCFGCRLDYSYDWAARSVCEAQMHDKNCLILLTYRDMPKDKSLQLNDWRNFMKRLVREVGKVRFLHAGEYGTRNSRPHDHAILFGFDFPDKRYFKKSAAGFALYRSRMLEEIWGKGNASVGACSFQSAGYLARYLMDKPTLMKGIKDENGIQVGRTWTEKATEKYGEMVDKKTGEIRLLRRPEYLTMSRNPGLGETWLRRYWRDIYPHDYFTLGSGARMPPPRYFDNKVAEWKLVDMDKIKLNRMQRTQKKEEVWSDILQKMQLLDVNRDDRLAVMEEVKKAQLNIYKMERGAHV